MSQTNSISVRGRCSGLLPMARFQQVLDAVRRELAAQYLTPSALDLSEIAYVLGYEEASSFHRAFHH